MIISVRCDKENIEEVSKLFSGMPNMTITASTLSFNVQSYEVPALKELIRINFAKIDSYYIDLIQQAKKPRKVKVPESLAHYLTPNPKAAALSPVRKPSRAKVKKESVVKVETSKVAVVEEPKESIEPKTPKAKVPRATLAKDMKEEIDAKLKKSQKPTPVIETTVEESIQSSEESEKEFKERPNKRALIDQDTSKMIEVLTGLFRLNDMKIPDNQADARDYIVKEAIIAFSKDMTPKLMKKMIQQNTLEL
jgi:hypothetical protein